MILTEEQINKLLEQFNELGQKALGMNHYELAEETEEHDAVIWRNFLMEPKVVDMIRSEMDVIRNTQLNKLVQEAAQSRSVGQSQFMNALLKMDEIGAKKEGPTFVYCYVPLSNEQINAPNVILCDEKGYEVTTSGQVILDDTDA